MSEQLMAEELHRISELPRLCKALHGTDPHTLVRWGFKGVKAPNGTTVKLEMVRIGSCWKSSVEAVNRFLAALNATPTGQPAPRSPAHRKKAAAKADRTLAAAGR